MNCHQGKETLIIIKEQSWKHYALYITKAETEQFTSWP